MVTTSKWEIAFKRNWLKFYGLRITVQCLFCEFGRDEVDDEERQRKKNKEFQVFQEALAFR
jgi:hypothetical protein